MQRVAPVAVAVLVLGLVGSALGTAASVPGRAFSITPVVDAVLVDLGSADPEVAS